MSGRALVTGIAGQDGSYLAERLVADGWEVHGTVREQPGPEPVAGAVLHRCDAADAEGLARLVRELRPDRVFSLAGISSVAASWQDPVGTALVNGVAVVALLTELQRQRERGGDPVLVHAASAEIFGRAPAPQDETTPIAPVNPYGAAKALAVHSVRAWRAGGLRASNAILFNHESPRRPERFVSRKITLAAARIALGRQQTLRLGNLDAARDFGWAPDYADAMLRMGEHPRGGDWVVATGESRTVRELVRAAFRAAGVEDWESRVRIDPALFRPVEAFEQRGDASLARAELGWAPTAAFEQIVARMVAHDLELERAGGATGRDGEG
ncbi:MAG: GDP-mannose 4,6-dehydratase [Pseudoclavibacter sp.]|nr:GDP-mannose 4,6-dehydratase [Pseudoclavibacter sp.]